MEKTYWDNAGDVGYENAMFKGSEAGRHMRNKMWGAALHFSRQLGVTSDARVMDLGCGDGFFANNMLARNFASVDGFELSAQAIERANAMKAPNATFRAQDIIRMDYDALGRYDAVFMIGILHHVKAASPAIMKSIAKITDKVIVLEPNGNHIVRKLLEKTATYKAAGEDSFRKTELFSMFENAGFNVKIYTPMNIFPNFVPDAVFKPLLPLEPFIERTPLLHGLCTNRMFGLQK